MYRQILALALLATAAACDRGHTLPGDPNLSAADARELAASFDAFAAALFVSPAGLAGAEVMTGTVPVRATRPCPSGGSTAVDGTVTYSVDAVARSGSFSVAVTSTPNACAFPRKDGGTFSITGDPSIAVTATQSFAAGVPGVRTATQKGAFVWMGPGGSGNCRVDLASSFDPAKGTRTVKGTFCGFPVDETR